MKKIGLIAAAGLLASAGMAYGQGSIQLQLVGVSNDAVTGVNTYDAGPAMWDGNGSFSIDLFVQASILGDAGATGLTTFDGRLTDDGTGSYAPSALTNTDAIGFPVPGMDFQMRTGLTPDYRSVIGDNTDPGNGADDGMGGWTFLPISTSPTGVAGAVGGFDDVYRVTWSTSDPTARTVVLEVGAAGGGYQGATGLVTTDQIGAGRFVIEIIPAPGAAALMGLGGLVALRRRR